MPVVASSRQQHQAVEATPSSWEDWRPALDRCLLISWLLKDLGWMTTNVYLAWPFGLLSICLHVLVLVIDWSSSVANRFYHTSLVLWIVGNFLWMSVEFMVNTQSSSIHLGPETPLGGMTAETGDKLTNIKSKLFLVAIFLQLTLFVCIRFDIIQMPNDTDSEMGDRDDDERDSMWEEDDIEMLRRLEEVFYLKQGGGAEAGAGGEVKTIAPEEGTRVGREDRPSPPPSSSSPSSPSKTKPHKVSRSVSASSSSSGSTLSPDDTSVLDSFRRFIPTTKKYPLGFSLTFIENGYIVLWICKDYFWSWATGDFDINRNAGYVTEFVSMFFGVLSVCLYTFVAYAWRKNFVNLMDSLTSWCWLFSNFTWMAGEIFIRYDSMRLSDDNQGDDGLTRLASGIFFIVGINIQVCVLIHFVLEDQIHSSPPSSSSGRDRFKSGDEGSDNKSSVNNKTRNIDSSSSESGGGRVEKAIDLPHKWTDIEISGGGGGGRLPKLALGFLPKMGSGLGTHKFVNIQSMDGER